MEVDIGQRAAFRRSGIFELHMLKVHVAVFNLVNRIFRVLQAARLIEHLADSLAGGLCHGEHDEDHGEHHQAHKNLHGIGNHAGQTAHAEVGAAGHNDKLCGEEGDENHRRVHAELHDRAIERKNLFCLQEVRTHRIGCSGELLRLIILAHKAFDYTHALHIFLHRVVEGIIFFENCLKKRHRTANHEKQRKAEDRNDPCENECKPLTHAGRHDNGKYEHHRRTHCDPNQHHERILNIGHVRRQPGNERGRGEPVDIRKRKALHLIKQIVAQIFCKACSSLRREPAGKRTKTQ